MAILSQDEREIILRACDSLEGEGMPADYPVVAQLRAIAGPDHDADNGTALLSLAAQLSPASPVVTDRLAPAPAVDLSRSPPDAPPDPTTASPLLVQGC